MRKLLLLIIALASICMVADAQSRKRKKANADTEQFRYDVEYLESAGAGVSNVKVWSYSRRASIAYEQCRKNAVHGVIFKGYSGSGATHRPLFKDISVFYDQKEFFDSFFADGGEYQRYVISSTTQPEELTKIGKDYKALTTVKVNVQALRKRLEEANIITSLANGF